MKKLLMSLSLMLLAQGFMNSDVNAVGSEKNDAQRDIRECQKDSDKHREPKELISIFDQTAKKFSKSGDYSYANYVVSVKDELNGMLNSLKAYIKSAHSHYMPIQKKQEERLQECRYAMEEVEKKVAEYLRERYHLEENTLAAVSIVYKEPKVIIKSNNTKVSQNQIAAAYRFSYGTAPKDSSKLPDRWFVVLKSANQAPEFEYGDIVKIKHPKKEQYMTIRSEKYIKDAKAIVLEPQDIVKFPEYNEYNPS